MLTDWLAGQKEAFQAAMNGAPLGVSLGVLTGTAIQQMHGQARCAFFIANGTELHHVTGMPESYAKRVEGFKIGPESLGCGVAVHRGEPVITPDVREDPRWKPCLWLAEEGGYRACWSFPVETSTGKMVGTFALYFKEPREVTLRDREFAALMTQAAAIIISRFQEAQEKELVAQTLAKDLTDMQLLQSISAELAAEGNVQSLYEKIVDAAIAIMHSEYGSMQMLHPERGDGGELRLLAFRGLNPEAAQFWEWVRADSSNTCGMALRTRQRVVVSDLEQYEGSDDLAMYRQTGIRACQTTPLISRAGKVVGMLSTHWRNPHQPSERDVRSLDILARQAADAVERKLAEEALLRSEKLAASGRMAACIAHEINNPLEAVTNLLFLLRSSVNDETGSRNLALAEEELARVAQITKKTLAFYRDTSTSAQVNLPELIDSVLVVFAHTIAEKQIRLNKTYNFCAVEGFKGELQQLFSNLIANAIDAVASGGEIEISVDREGEQAVVSLRDNGMGILKEHMPKLFEPFFTTKEAHRGTGLGLWVCDEIVRKHGAEITVETKTDSSNHGTTFKVRFASASAKKTTTAAD